MSNTLSESWPENGNLNPADVFVGSSFELACRLHCASSLRHPQGNAYLAQSPQLYKQMALMTDMFGELSRDHLQDVDGDRETDVELFSIFLC